MTAPIGPLALAYARTDSNTIGVLGRQVPTGTTLLEATGAELGADDVSTATLTVQYDQIEDSAGGAYQPHTSALAGLDITISGSLRDEDGQELYDGPLIDVELGHVDVTCAGTTSPPVTTPPPTQPAVTDPPITIPPVTIPPITLPPTTPPITRPPTATPTPTKPGPSHKPDYGYGDGDDRDY
ncbi:hypothetical protein ACWFRT_03655 [Streptomyces anulatus]